MKIKLYEIILLLFAMVLMTGCYKRFVMSEKEIKAYYKTHGPEPQYFSYDTLNRSIFYAHAGDCNLPLLLFIHGAPGRWYGYKQFLNDSSLLKHFQIISVDRPGYGKSAKGGALVSIKEQALLLQPIINQYEQVPIFVIGRSYVAPIAAYLAANNQDKVKGLMLISNAAAPQLEKFWWFSKPAHSAIGKMLLRKPLNVAGDEKFAHQKELELMLPKWKEIMQPTIVLQGGKDVIISPENGHFTDSVLVNAPHQYIFLPENGHLISSEAPDTVIKYLFILKSWPETSYSSEFSPAQ